MPKFPENTGFKLPGLGSKEINTPGNFRKDQGVEDVGYCDNTESHMLPEGSSPLLKIDPNLVVPEYYKTSYSKTNWPTFRKKSQGKSECADGSHKDSKTGKCIPVKDAGEDLDTKVEDTTTGGEKTNVRKTWKQAWADNDENIQDKYKSYSDYVADRSGQKEENPEGYEKDLYDKTGVAGGPGQSTTKDESKTTSEYEVNGKSVTKEEYCAARPNDSRC